jgi:hypothetical protein
MKPTQATTESELKVIRWFLLVFGVCALLLIGITWANRIQECQAKCELKGFDEGKVSFRGGGRFNQGVYCKCA